MPCCMGSHSLLWACIINTSMNKFKTECILQDSWQHFFFIQGHTPECLIRSVFALHPSNQLTFPCPSIFPIFTIFLSSSFGTFLSFLEQRLVFLLVLLSPHFMGAALFPSLFQYTGKFPGLQEKDGQRCSKDGDNAATFF